MRKSAVYSWRDRSYATADRIKILCRDRAFHLEYPWPVKLENFDTKNSDLSVSIPAGLFIPLGTQVGTYGQYM